MTDEAIATPQDASTETEAAESYPGSQFGRHDLQEFSSDDTEATTNIGKMLTIFFGYSLLAMIVVTLWTYWVAFRT